MRVDLRNTSVLMKDMCENGGVTAHGREHTVVQRVHNYAEIRLLAYNTLLPAMVMIS